MFLSFTPNPCLERTLTIPDFAAGNSRRIASAAVQVSAGGKGFNAARVAASFGAQSEAMGAVGQHQIGAMRALCEADSVTAHFAPVEAETRQCLNILHGDGENTEIIENGAPLSTQTGTQLLEIWRRNLPRARLAAIGGAYPPGCAPGFELHAALLCQMAKSAGVPVIYDGRGEHFSRALRSNAPPWAIKPNLAEAEVILNRAIQTLAEERRAIRDLRALGAEIVLLSCGARGLYLGHAGGIEWFSAPRVEAISGVGCGDALVGAFAAQIIAGTNLLEAARWGVAAGSASAAHAMPARITREEAMTLLPQVKHETVEIALSGL